ncbi:BTB/POZ domain-containing protein 6-like [Saccostrea cucullata]|uniref:BTB/POZ domain-containing protein 6-like n=1 Tax=Saccostrea cuccullata TaxID=36930 RepID=UPI002ED4DCF1
MSVSNVCSIMESAHTFNDAELLRKCREFFYKESVKCIQSESFLDLCAECIDNIISSDELTVEEYLILERVLEWADAECVRKDKDLNDANRRQALGKILNHIRFPIMDSKYFAENVACREILSKSERLAIFTFICSGHKSQTDCNFKTSKRRGRYARSSSSRQNAHMSQSNRQRVAMRFAREGHVSLRNENLWYVGQKSDKIDFTSSKTIYIHGIVMYGCGIEGTEYSVNASILRTGLPFLSNELSHVSTTVPVRVPYKTFNVFFPEPVHISPNIKYTISVTMQGPRSYWGEGGEESVTSDGVQFDFHKSSGEANGTDVDHGQIPGLIFIK